MFKKEKNVPFNKKVNFVFHTLFPNADHVLHSLFIQLAKVQLQNAWKKKLGVSEYGPWICNLAN